MYSWIEKSNYICIGQKKSSKVRSFVLVAVWARICQVFNFISTTMFSAYNMIYFKR